MSPSGSSKSHGALTLCFLSVMPAFGSSKSHGALTLCFHSVMPPFGSSKSHGALTPCFLSVMPSFGSSKSHGTIADYCPCLNSLPGIQRPKVVLVKHHPLPSTHSNGDPDNQGRGEADQLPVELHAVGWGGEEKEEEKGEEEEGEEEENREEEKE